MPADHAATALKTTWETEAATVGGLVTAALGHLPVAGETVRIGDFELEVERVAERAVETVVARRVTGDANGAETH
jgi:Mg2+/Co2+ transporter CorC